MLWPGYATRFQWQKLGLSRDSAKAGKAIAVSPCKLL